MTQLYDPLAGVLPLAIGSRRATRTPGPTEQEIAQATRDLTNESGGFLSGLFNLLELPASMVRDVTTGSNPLDQLLSPFSQRNRTSYIPEGAGLTDPKFYGGLAAEIATDPLTYLTFGASALTKAGKAAKAVGALDDVVRRGQSAGKGRRLSTVTATFDDLAAPQRAKIAQRLGTTQEALQGQRLANAANFNFPFMGAVGLGAPGRGTLGASRQLDTAGQAIRQSGVGRKAHQLFNPLVRNFFDPLAQRFARATTVAERAGERNARTVVGSLRTAAKTAGLDDTQIRQVMEGVGSLPKNAPPEAQKAFGEARKYLDGLLAEAKHFGLDVGEFKSTTGALYFPRQATWGKGRAGLPGPVSEESQFRPSKFGKFVGKNPHSIRRIAPFRNIEGETESIRKILMDEDLNNLINGGASKEQVAMALTDRYGSIVPESFETSTGKTVDQREALADILMKLTPEERAVGLFGNDPLFDLRLYGEWMESSLATYKQSIDWLAHHAGQEGQHTVGDTLHEIRLKHTGSKKGQGSMARILERLPDNLKEDLMAGFEPPKPREVTENGITRKKPPTPGEIKKAAQAHLRKAAKGLTVPDELYKAVTGLNAAHTDRKVAQETAGWMDSLTNWFKASVTVPWPAFHVRNLYGGQFANYITGHYRSAREGAKTFRQIDQFATGQASTIPVAKDLPAVREELSRRGMELNDENATAVLMEFEFADDLVHREPMTVADQLTAAGDPLQTPRATGTADTADISVPPVETRRVEMLGDRTFPSLGTSLRTLVGREPGTTLNPLAVRGARGQQVSRFGPVAAGEQVTHRVELLNRLTPYVELMAQGYDPKKAAELVKAAQVDYSSRSFTDFEKRVMKRAFPFYSWQSRMIPFTVRSLIEKPQLRGVVRAQERATEKSEHFVPDKYRRQPAVTLGQPNEQGYLQVLSGLDLAHNAALEPFQFGPTLGGSLERTGRGLAGSMHPLLKYAVEQGMGVSTFTGRNTEELEGGLSRVLQNVGEMAGGVDTPKISQPVDNALLTMGLSRLVAPLRQLTDPRTTLAEKAVQVPTNFLTGARISTYDPAQALSNAMRDVTREKGLAGENLAEFNRLYVPKHRQQYLLPDEALRLQIANTLDERARTVRETRAAMQQAVGP